METLQNAAAGAPGLARGFAPMAYARSIGDSNVQYELCFAIEDFADVPLIQSEVVKRLVDALNGVGISIGSAPTDVRIVRGDSLPVVKSPPVVSKASLPPTKLPVATA
jgi:small-conductance mechanosensitive channel